MARKKVNLQWISNKSSQRATYKRRYEVLVEKASELTTLCGSKACMVVYGEGEAQPMGWPTDEGAKLLLEKFNGMPDVGTSKRYKTKRSSSTVVP
jgi:hypothetical protein